eukprot:CFRG0887T1
MSSPTTAMTKPLPPHVPSPTVESLADKETFRKKSFVSGIEYSVHDCPPRMLKELPAVFPDVALTGLLIVPTFQRTKVDLTAIGPEVEEIKEECLYKFYRWGTGVCKAVEHRGYWADMADPATGYPMLGKPGVTFYPEVIGAQTLLGYDMIQTGCCQMVCHPLHGTRVYPASLFTTAPKALLEKCFEACKDMI